VLDRGSAAPVRHRQRPLRRRRLSSMQSGSDAGLWSITAGGARRAGKTRFRSPWLWTGRPSLRRRTLCHTLGLSADSS